MLFPIVIFQALGTASRLIVFVAETLDCGADFIGGPTHFQDLGFSLWAPMNAVISASNSAVER